METVYQTRRFSKGGYMHRVDKDTKTGKFYPWWRHRSQRNYCGTFECNTLEEAKKHLERH